MRRICGALLLLLSPVALPAPATPDAHWSLFGRYCGDCHNVQDWAGGIAFDTLDPRRVSEDAEVWEKVINRLRGHLMPPPGNERPGNAELYGLVDWLERRIDDTASAQSRIGHVALHRLNRREYANAVKYLLATDVDVAALLPQDDVSDGFDTVANVLQVSPSFLDQYLAAARTVAVQAVGNPLARPVGVPYVNRAVGKQVHYVEGLPLGTRGGMAVLHNFPADGEYELNINDMARALWVEGMEFENTLIATLDGAKFYQTKLGGDADQKSIDQKGDPSVDAINSRLKKIRFKARAGSRRVAVTFLARSFAESDARLSPVLPGGGEERILRVKSFEIRGPFAPSGVSDTASRTRIFTCRPQAASEEQACAREILTTIARRAYRRPLTPSDERVLLQAYTEARAGASFDGGIRGGLTRILAAPSFLYRNESPTTNGLLATSNGEARQLDDLQLASRLSFFLWSNLPDDELLALAESSQLHTPAVLQRQIERMLKDPRAATLAGDFAHQWLGLDKLKDIEPDPSVFPYVAVQRDTDGDPRGNMREEIRLFVDDIFRNDRSVLRLLDGRRTFLNEPLALLYGIGDVKGDAFRAVELTNPARFGLLGKGGVLMVSSYPNRTAPVLRGAWIMDNLTGTPPTPPPPNVEALKDNEPGKNARTVRELMAAHSSNKTCHACHGVLDPLGFALENFDGVGRWRDKDRSAGTVIDASGVLPDGTRIDGPVALRNALLARPEQFVQTLTLRLLTYATGRGMTWRDMPTVRAITREAARQDYRFTALVTAIVNSPAFRMQGVAPSLPQQRQAALDGPR